MHIQLAIIQQPTIYIYVVLTCVFILNDLSVFTLADTNENDDRTDSSVNNQITKMINPGDRINIPCSVVSPGGSVQWVQNGKPILLDFSETQRRHWNISNDGQAALTINRVTKTDEGIWECWKLDSDGKVKKKAHVMKLVVTNIPEAPFLEMEGRRLADQATITVRENNVLTLHCVVRGASPPVSHIFWYMADHNVTQSAQLLMEYSPQEDVSMAISVLSINVTKELHTKLVICQVYHVSWLHSATVSASFNVLYVPSFSISREPGFGFPVIEGMPFSLKCEIDANPLSTAKWYREVDTSVVTTSDQRTEKSAPTLTDSKSTSSSANEIKKSLPQLETNADGSLNFTSITKDDSGWYRCQTEHEFGHAESFGYYLNVRTHDELPEELQQQILQSSLSLNPLLKSSNSINKESESQIEQQPRPNEAALRKATSQQHEQHENLKASFQASSISNSADIMANAGFLHKHHQERHSLYDSSQHQQQHHRNSKECRDNNGKPVIESINRTLNAMVGKPLALSAKFCCNPRPKKVYWIHRHLAMTPGRIIGPYITRELMLASNSNYCYTSTFVIDSLKPEDAGEVVLIVGNSKGLDESMVLLNITQAGFSVSRGCATLSLQCTGHRFGRKDVHFLLLAIMTLASLMRQWS